MRGPRPRATVWRSPVGRMGPRRRGVREPAVDGAPCGEHSASGEGDHIVGFSVSGFGGQYVERGIEGGVGDPGPGNGRADGVPAEVGFPDELARFSQYREHRRSVEDDPMALAGPHARALEPGCIYLHSFREVDVGEEEWAGRGATHEHERAIQARRTGTEGLDSGEAGPAAILHEPGRLALPRYGVGAPYSEEEFPRGD